MRKESGFAVSYRIVLTVAGSAEVQAVVQAHGAWIAEEVLAAELVFAGDIEQARGRGGEHDMHAMDLDGITAYVAITRIQ